MNKSLSDNQKIALWGAAEQAATTEGGNPSLAFEQWDDWALLGVGNVYRTSGNTFCAQLNCANSFFDPRVTAGDLLGNGDTFSPVGYVESFIYSFDYMIP